ncbi:glycosyltransferase [Tsuneonella aeria]|uniref:glycosyltransferase n=1 Tax=Tsuneonella aeria TaxID=1837929 RepID=UPI00301D2D0C
MVLAHNEARRIARCLDALPRAEGISIHCVVNGSTDSTAAIARSRRDVDVREYPRGGKARSWNRFVLEEAPRDIETFVFVDGDAQVAAGSVEALSLALARNPGANAAAGMPLNGRRAERYRAEMIASHGLFGDLYALRGTFVERMRQAGIRLPEDLVGDDSLIGALAKTDLGNEDCWVDARIVPCVEAGFRCDPVSWRPAQIRMQYRRMIAYSVRHRQNAIISRIMRGPGPVGLPRQLSALYREELDRAVPGRGWRWRWFDRQALRQMRQESLPA